MPRSFRYGLQFVVKADVTPALRQIGRLNDALAGVGRRQGAQPRVGAKEIEGETKATKDATDATKDHAKAKGNLYGIIGKGLKTYWTLVSVFYILRNAMGAVINVYQALIKVVRTAAGAMAGLVVAVVANSSAFEDLRTRIAAVAPTAEMGLRTWEKLKDFVIGMPFTLREAADAYVYLEATGIRKTMGLMRSMHAAATMAKVMDRSMKDAALAIAKLGAGNMQRLTRGFAISSEQLLPFGAMAGRAAGTLEHKAPGAAEANVEALFRFVESKWGTLLGRMANTWAQLVNDMTDIWEQLMDAVGEQGVLMAFKEILAYIREIRNVFKDTGVLDRWAKAIADAWRPIIEMVGPWMENLPSLMETLVGWIVTLGEKTEAWLKSIGGLEGAWDRLLINIQTYGPAVIEILRGYTNIMLSLGQAMMTVAGASLLVNPLLWAAAGGPKQAWAMSKALMAGFKATGAVKAGVNTAAEELQALMRGGLKAGPGGFPLWEQRERITAGDVAATLTNLPDAIEDGAEAGIVTGLEKVFGKAAMDKSREIFNPYVAMYRLMTGGLPARRPRISPAILGPSLTEGPFHLSIPEQAEGWERLRDSVRAARIAELMSRPASLLGPHIPTPQGFAEAIGTRIGLIAGGFAKFLPRFPGAAPAGPGFRGIPPMPGMVGPIEIRTFLDGRELRETAREATLDGWEGRLSNMMGY